MLFKFAPTIGPRYWTAMALASVCGANMGDFVADELHMGHLQGLPALAVLFAAIALGARGSLGSTEACYWLAILVVRSAATNLADSAIAGAGLSYVAAAIVLALLLAATVAARRASSRPGLDGGAPRADGLYWVTMLTAGTLGTVVADGMAHAIMPLTVGVPVAGVVATAALALALGLRGRAAFASAASYWIIVVVVRTWGTNVGDIAGYLLSRPVSLLASGTLLVVLLVRWREPRRAATPATA